MRHAHQSTESDPLFRDEVASNYKLNQEVSIDMKILFETLILGAALSSGASAQTITAPCQSLVPVAQYFESVVGLGTENGCHDGACPAPSTSNAWQASGLVPVRRDPVLPGLTPGFAAGDALRELSPTRHPLPPKLPHAGRDLAPYFGAVAAPAQPLRDLRWHTNRRDAARVAAERKLPMLIQVTADWCGYCRKMERETFVDPVVVRHLSHCFVPLTVDADRNPQFMAQLGIRSLPTTLIVSPDLKIVRRLEGFQSAPQLTRQLAAFCGDHRRPAPRPAAPKRSPAHVVALR